MWDFSTSFEAFSTYYYVQFASKKPIDDFLLKRLSFLGILLVIRIIISFGIKLLLFTAFYAIITLTDILMPAVWIVRISEIIRICGIISEENPLGKIVGRRYRYTSDYKTTRYLGPSGREEKRIVYIGKWIRPLNDESQLRRIVLTARVFVAVTLIAVLFSLFILPPPAEGKWYVIALVVSLFPIAYEVLSAFLLSAKAEKFERIKFDKSFIRLRTSSVICIVTVLLAAVGLIIYWALALFKVFEPPAPYSLRDALFALGIIAVLASSFIINNQMKLVRTEELENNTKL